jgi:ribose transport system permease protein
MISKSMRLKSVLAKEGAGVLAILVLLFVFLSVASDHFLTGENITNLLLQSVFVMLVAFGMSFVLATGGIDLSVGSVLGLSAGVTGWLMMQGANLWIAIAAGLALGAIIGAVNGLIITRLGISPFLVTFSMLYIARGLLMLLTEKEPIRDFASAPFKFLAQGDFLGIPMPVWITLAILAVCHFIFEWTGFGRRVVSVGSNDEASHLSGISNAGIRMGVYVLSGLLAAVSGVLLASRLTSVQPLMGTSYELDAIAAAVIGGTSMFGGKANMTGVAIGAVILALVSNGLDLLGVNQFYRSIVTGLIIVAAVGAERWTARTASA